MRDHISLGVRISKINLYKPLNSMSYLNMLVKKCITLEKNQMDSFFDGDESLWPMKENEEKEFF